MDVSSILKKLEGISGKRKSDLTKTYNSIKKKKASEGLDESILPKDKLERIILIGVCKRYDIKVDIDDLLNDNKEPEEEDIELELDEDTDEFLDEVGIDLDEWNDIQKDEKEENNKQPESWKEIFSAIQDPEDFDGASFERLPTIKIMDNVQYHLRLINPSEMPFKYNGTGRDGKPYTSFKMDVQLLKVYPEEMLDEVGANNKPSYKLKNKYSIWLNETGFGLFGNFWMKTLGLNQPDKRIWIFRRTKKTSKKGRQYNWFIFKAPKK